MITSGIDMSTDPGKTGLVEIDWDGSHGTVTRAETGIATDEIVAAARRSDWLGLDVPLGWPQAFVDFLPQQATQFRVPDDDSLGRWQHDLTHRLTDRRVGATTEAGGIPVKPRSVAADKLGMTAMTASVVQARLRDAGRPVDRTGRSGPVIEVHPDASLAQWGIRPGRTSGPGGTDRRGEILVELEDRSDLDVAGRQDACVAEETVFDALIAALTARSHSLGLTVGPSPVVLQRVAQEGWIALPAKVQDDASLWSAAHMENAS